MDVKVIDDGKVVLIPGGNSRASGLMGRLRLEHDLAAEFLDPANQAKIAAAVEQAKVKSASALDAEITRKEAELASLRNTRAKGAQT